MSGNEGEDDDDNEGEGEGEGHDKNHRYSLNEKITNDDEVKTQTAYKADASQSSIMPVICHRLRVFQFDRT